MYAVVSTGGKQLKVEKGTEAVVEKLSAEPGDAVTFDVLFISDDGSFITDKDALASATVTAEVIEHFKGEKAIVFKFKKRKGYKRLKGHRQNLTRVRITDIVAVGGPKKAEAAKPAKAEKAPAPKVAAAEKPKAEKLAKAETKAAAEPKAAAAEKPKAAKPKAAKPKAEKAAAVETATDQCEAIKSNGERCANKAKEGSKYCGVHAKKYDA
ncbi:MAG: 50S ribosomal protein L21 [Coriobacteriia bacterium]